MELLTALGILTGVVTGVAGLVLGILNHVHLRNTTRPRVEVRARIGHIVDRNPTIGSDRSARNVGLLEIRNVGHIPIVGSLVGFMPPTEESGEAIFFAAPTTVGGPEWGGTLSPGQCTMLQFKWEDLIVHMNAGILGRAYAQTAIGDNFKASPDNHKQFLLALKTASSEQAITSKEATTS